MEDSVKVTSNETVTISMSREHAITLLDVLWKVGGSALNTGRGRIDDLSNALEEAGYLVHDLEWRRHHLEGAIYFLDLEPPTSDEGTNDEA